MHATRFGDSNRPWNFGVSGTPPEVKRPDLAAFQAISVRLQGWFQVHKLLLSSSVSLGLIVGCGWRLSGGGHVLEADARVDFVEHAFLHEVRLHQVREHEQPALPRRARI